ncbi:MAG: choice-of-anchor A family protein [Proteobacteria bacterium]|nr:choice-of-anchor A family protein [Pseudomonadota bacterium]
MSKASLPRRAALLSVVALVAAVSATGALAAPSAAAGLQAMRDYDLIVLGNMTANGDVEGRSLITGNLSGSGTFFNSPHGQTTATLPGLVVGGNITSGENLNNGSGAWVGGSIGGMLNLNGGGNVLYNGTTVFQNNAGAFTDTNGTALNGLPMSLADYAASLTLLSSQLAADPTTQSGPTSLVSNNLNITAIGGASGLGVIDLNGALLASGNQINVDSGGYSVLVVNVSGTSDSIGLNPGLFSANEQTTVIFNFYQATSLTVSREFHGSILAPLATVTNTSPIDGTLVAAAFNQGGEVHMNNFAGVIPEPAGWALMILGFGGAGGLLRRRRASAAA